MNYVCVKCKKKDNNIPLVFKENLFFCKNCQSEYPIEQGIIQFVPPNMIEGELYRYYNEEYEGDNPEWHLKDAEWKYKQMKPMLAHIEHLERVVDVGIGAGAILMKLSEDFCIAESVGVDLSISILKQTKTHASNFTLIQAESSNLPFETKWFDLVLLIDILEHVPHPLETLLEAKRVSEYIFIKVPLEISFKNFIKKKFFGIDWKEEFGHLHKYSEKAFNELITETRLKHVEAKTAKAPLSLYENISVFKSFLIVLFNGIDKLFHLKQYQLNESNLFILCRSEQT